MYKEESSDTTFNMGRLHHINLSVGVKVKNIKRRLPTDRSQGPLSFPASVGLTITQCANNMATVIRLDTPRLKGE